MTASEGATTHARCGKKQYITQQYAQFKVRMMKELKLPGASKLTEYRCGYCGYWHVGNRRKRTGEPTR